MMLANYNSDSGSESENESGPSRPAAPPPRPSVTASSSAQHAQSGAAKPVAGRVKRKGPVKITLDLPKGSTETVEDGDAGMVGSDDESERKKPKLGGMPKGKGSSALLGMLPPPKRKTPGASKTTSSLAVNKSMAKPPPPPAPLDMPDLSDIRPTNADDDDEEDTKRANMLLPPSVRAKQKAKAAEPAIDLFGLSTPSTSTSVPLPSSSKPSIPPSISSAPAAPDFVPPAPTPKDPYPGYYQTPSGQWQAYDPDYYASFFASDSDVPRVKLQGETDDDDGRVGRHWDEFNVKGANVVDVDVSDDIKKARAEEERKNLMKKPKAKDEFEYQTIGQTKGLAAQRHQLTSLLQTAYSSREELEERIAQNKKNMRLAGQKYGF